MKKLIPLIVCAFLLSCEKPEDGKNSLINTIIVPKGADCSNGGYKLLTGLDLNSDDILQDTEVQNTKFVCNGVSGNNSLVSLIVEPAGANCTTGGYKLNSGLDLNNDNILDPAEVTSSKYICNGLNGSNSLISLITESAGTNCSTGGYKLNTGVDVNKNGTLETTEIQNTKYICNGANGLHYLIGIVAEPSGSNCAFGGYRINTGVDVNGSGTLDNNEITKSQYICNDAPSLTDGLIAYWPLNGSGSDLSGNNNTATLNNTTATVDRFGNANSALYFNGISSYAQVADKAALRLSNTDFTINSWIKLDEYNASFGSVIVNKRIAGINNGWGVSITGQTQNTGGVFTGSYGPGGGSINAIGTFNIGLGTWHKLTVVYKLATQEIRLYLDGVLYNTVTGISSANSAITAPLSIGKDSAGDTYYLKGRLDEIRIYNRILTDYEINQL